MTDGILLAEIQRDRLLRRYDTLIIDEAHERSLNIDFLLGYLKRILPERPDLKVIVSSATIETERFAAFFGGAPVIEVSGRTFPVEVLYRPPDEDTDLAEASATPSTSCARAARRYPRVPRPASARSARPRTRSRAGCATREILPLYARLSAAEQQRVFKPRSTAASCSRPMSRRRRSPFPASSTSSTPGSARISRYSAREVQRLPSSPSRRRARTSARAAAGACRGHRIRLYDEEDFAERPRFTDPEILRTASPR